MEKKMTAVNETAKIIGIALRQARISSYIPRDNVARMLRISPKELRAFETAQTAIPMSVLQCLFAQALNMMNARDIQIKYTEYSRRLRDLDALEI